MGAPCKKIVVGAPGPASEPAAALVASILTAADINTVHSTNIQADVWHKLVGNAIWNPMSALTLQPIGYLSHRSHTVHLAGLIGREVVQVAEAAGATSPGELCIDQRLETTRNNPPGFRTSMLQDVEAGKEPEVGPILSAIVEIADQVGVPVPTLRLMQSLMIARADAIIGEDTPEPQDSKRKRE